MSSQPDNRELIECARRWAAINYPGFPLELLTMQLHGLPKIKLAAPPCECRPPGPPAPIRDVATAPDDFEPNDYQALILEVLEYRALRAEGLVNELERRGANGDRRRLWKPGGVKELLAAGWVAKDDGPQQLGYYRPDMPPAELKDGP